MHTVTQLRNRSTSRLGSISPGVGPSYHKFGLRQSIENGKNAAHREKREISGTAMGGWSWVLFVVPQGSVSFLVVVRGAYKRVDFSIDMDVAR